MEKDEQMKEKPAKRRVKRTPYGCQRHAKKETTIPATASQNTNPAAAPLSRLFCEAGLGNETYAMLLGMLLECKRKLADINGEKLRQQWQITGQIATEKRQGTKENVFNGE